MKSLRRVLGRQPYRFLRSSRPVRLVPELPEHTGDDDEGKDQRADVAEGLGALDADEPEGARQDQQRGNQEDALAGDGQQRGAHAVTDGLGEHVAHDDDPPQRHRRQLQPQLHWLASERSLYLLPALELP